MSTKMGVNHQFGVNRYSFMRQDEVRKAMMVWAGCDCAEKASERLIVHLYKAFDSESNDTVCIITALNLKAGS